MARLTRRTFLKQTSTGVAGATALGALAAVPGAALAAQRPARTLHLPEMADAEPFLVYVRNPAAGELTLLIGNQEITHTDPALVAHLWRAGTARRSTGASSFESTGR